MKIVQVIPMENNCIWQGVVLGLSSTGDLYEMVGCGWVLYCPSIVLEKTTEGKYQPAQGGD